MWTKIFSTKGFCNCLHFFFRNKLNSPKLHVFLIMKCEACKIFVGFKKKTSLALKMMNPQKNTLGQIGQSRSSVFRLLWQSQGKQQNRFQVSWVASKVLCQGQTSNCAKDIAHRGSFLEAPRCPLNVEDHLTKNKQIPV